MMRRTAAAALALCLSTLSAGASAQDAAAPSAEKVAAAKTLFDEGQALMDQKKFGDACAKFRASADQVAKIGTLLNLADCFEKNGQNASAWGTYNEAIALGRRQNRPDYEEFARKKVDELAPTLLKLTVVVPPEAKVEGLVVLRDKTKLDEGAWGVALAVDPGSHTMEVSAPRKLAIKREVVVAPDQKSSEFRVPKLEDAPVEAPKVETQVVTKVVEAHGFFTPMRIAGTVLTAVGVASLAGGVVFGTVAQSTWNDAKKACGGSATGPCPAGSDGPNKSQTALTFATTSTVLFVAGGVAAVGGVVLMLLGAPKVDEEDAKQAHARPAIWPLLGIGSAGVGGQF